MISKRTVFVLGAGASMPYGLPSGDALLKAICVDAADHISPMTQSLEAAGLATRQDLKNLAFALARSKQSSIDAFLARREDLWGVGKVAIAHTLCQRERPNAIYGECDGDDWYQLLWGAMTTGVDRLEQLAENQVRFVTFNYDRSLEFMLHEAIKHTFNVDHRAADVARLQIPVLHVYGQLGTLALSDGGDARAYSPSVSGDAIKIAASGLRIIPEARKDDSGFGEARAWFQWAQRICFLGFGFDPLNVERLGLASVLAYIRKHPQTERIPSLFASAYQMTPKEVTQRIHDPLGPTATTAVINDRNLMTLRTTGVLG